MRDCMLRSGILRKGSNSLTRLAATAAAATPAASSTPWAAFALAIAARPLFARFRRRGVDRLGALLGLGLLGFVRNNIFFVHVREWHWLRRGKAARGFWRVHLLTAIDRIRLLAGHCWVSGHSD